ncbi:hypothetical protein ACQY0O_000922 [Thecaphora frezii]
MAPPAPDPTRIPGAASSLKVQLSPAELFRSHHQSAAPSSSSLSPSSSSAAPSTAAGPSSYSFATPQQLQQQRRSHHLASAFDDSAIQPTDLQLLATSLLGNQLRQRQSLKWTEALINLEPSRPSSSSSSSSDAAAPRAAGRGCGVSRETLKRGLTYLSPADWLSVLDERFLAGSCPYPGCDNVAPFSPTSCNATAQYRISLKSRTVRRNTARDPGDRETFCSAICHKRSEWVREWVLKDRAGVGAPHNHTAVSVAGTGAGAGVGVGGGQGAPEQGGRWERMTDQEAWRDVELLEDLEESGEMHRLLGLATDAGDILPASTSATASPPPPQQQQQQQQQPSPPLTATRPTAPICSPRSSDPAQSHQVPSPTTAQDQVAQLLDSLTIHERPPRSHPSSHPPTSGPSKVAWDTDLPSHIGSRFHTPSVASAPAPASKSTALPKMFDPGNGDMAEDEDEDEDADLVLGLSSSKSLEAKQSIRTILSQAPLTLDRQQASIPEAQEDGQDQQEAQVDLEAIREARQTQMWMQHALEVRREQRELGLLD